MGFSVDCLSTLHQLDSRQSSVCLPNSANRCGSCLLDNVSPERPRIELQLEDLALMVLPIQRSK